MSTRAVYTFQDAGENEAFHVYKHSDGYPEGAREAIQRALAHAWQLPRFEADEFAAAFVAANKPSADQKAAAYRADAEKETDPERKKRMADMADRYITDPAYRATAGGGVRLMTATEPADFPGDIAYHYVVTFDGKHLRVLARGFRHPEHTGTVFDGTLDAMLRKNFD